MNRLLVALLAALDTLVQTAIGIALIAVPLTVLWVFALGATADWSALWPSTAAGWQLAHFVPLPLQVPEDVLVAMGLSEDAAAFTISLAPLALTCFTVGFGLRSGARAARTGRGWTGVATAALVSAALATLIALTARTDVLAPHLWIAVLCPAAVYAVSVSVGVIAVGWREGDNDGPIDRLRDRIDAAGEPWAAAVSAMIRGAGIAVSALVAVSAVVLAVTVVASADRIVGLFQAGNVDLVGAVLLILAQLAYLPTLIGWTVSWIAGPGFPIGAGTTVAPTGTDVGVMPSIPVLGAVPEGGSTWALLIVLLPVAVGAVAGWAARSHLVRTTAEYGRLTPRIVTAGGIALITAAGVALLAWASSGGLGPGALADVGPDAGPVALAVGLEVLIGAAILLLLPLSRRGTYAGEPIRVVDVADPIETDRPRR